MDDEALDPQLNDAVAALRAERRRCPDVERLLAHVEGRLDPGEEEAVERHLAICLSCAELVERARAAPPEVDDLTWTRAERRLDARRRPWQGAARKRAPRTLSPSRWLAVAAALVLAAGLAWTVLRTEPEGPIAEVRGAAIQVLGPRGEVQGAAALPAFEWAPTIPVQVSYRVEVERDGQTIWRGATEETRLEPPAELVALLAEGGAVRWRVLGIAPSGAVVAESPWTALGVVAP